MEKRNNLTMAMTPEQVDADAGLHINTIYKLIRENKLPHIKLTRRYLISRTEYEKWLAGEFNKPLTSEGKE